MEAILPLYDAVAKWGRLAIQPLHSWHYKCIVSADFWEEVTSVME